MLKWLFLIVVLIPVTVSVGWQQETNIAPAIIEIYPLTGMELGPDEQITISFNQPMKRESVEQALTFQPAVEPQFIWEADHILHIQLENQWEQGQFYEVTVETTAQAVTGLFLEYPYVFEIQTLQPIAVGAVGPSPDTNDVTVDAKIVVPFNRPIVPVMTTSELANLPAPLLIEPEIVGQGEWINTAMYVFTPHEPLRGGTTYTVTVPAGLTNIDGAFLPEDYTWSFQTIGPRVLEFLPMAGYEKLPLDRPLVMRFNQPMDHTSTEQAFRLFPKDESQTLVSGKFTWNEAQTEFSFQPDDRLRVNTNYTVEILPQAFNATRDTGILDVFRQDFFTVPLPGINKLEMNDFETDPPCCDQVGILFLTPMNFETLRGKILISPEPDEWYPEATSGDRHMSLRFPMQSETTYTVTILAGAEDVYGNAIVEDYTLSFTTRPTSNYASGGYNYLMVLDTDRPSEYTVTVRGQVEAQFQLYELDFQQASPPTYYSNDYTPVGTLVREWEQTLLSSGQDNEQIPISLAEDGGVLPLGIYELHYLFDTGEAEIPSWASSHTQIVIANANLTLKRTPDEIYVWVTNLMTGVPLADVPVTLYNQGQVIGQGVSDAEGIVRLSLEDLPDVYYTEYVNDWYHWDVWVVAQNDDTFGYWHSQWASSATARTEFLYTDRGIYRPGETVYFRGIIREKNDVTYTLPELETVHVKATVISYLSGTGQETILFESDLPVSEYGTYSGEFTLPQDVALGSGWIISSFKDHNPDYDYDSPRTGFSIQEYRVPEYYASVTPVQSEVIYGEPLLATIDAAYYAGGAVSNASVDWQAVGNPVYFPYTGEGRYRFLPYEGELQNLWDDGRDELLTTDVQGQYTIDIDLNELVLQRPTLFEIEGTIWDESGQQVTARNSLLVHPSAVYVGLRAESYFGQQNQIVTVQGITVTPQSEPTSQQLVELVALEIRWSRREIPNEYGQYLWEREEIEVGQAEVISNVDGTFTYTFTPERSGIYVVRADTVDSEGRRNNSYLQFWVRGEGRLQWGEQKNHQVTLIANKDNYQPGEMAEIIIPIPFSDEGETTVWISVERAEVFTYEIRQVERSMESLIFELPITEEHAPNVYISVIMFQSRSGEDPFPDYRTGSTMLEIVPEHQLLNIEITPSKETYRPGEEATFEILVTDSEGAPVPNAEVGVNLTDRAVLDLVTYYERYGGGCMTPPSLAPLEDPLSPIATAFYSPRSSLVQNLFSMSALVGADRTESDNAGGGCGGGGGGFPMPTIRTNFKTTPLWEAHLVTDENGHIRADVLLPDNLTRWQLNVVAITADTRVGQTKTEIVSTLPLRVRPITPRFFVVGDAVDVGAVINNATDEAQEVEVYLEADGVQIESENPQTILLEPQSRQQVLWRVIVEDVPGIDFTFSATSNTGLSDAAKPMLATGEGQLIPVYRYTASDTVGTAGILTESGTRLEGIMLPTRFDADNSSLTLEFTPSLAEPLMDSLRFLEIYPHHCIEQTVSRFLPNIVTYRLLTDLNVENPELEAGAELNFQNGLRKIRAAQNSDGGWGWFDGMQSDPLVTAYVMLGLAEASKANLLSLDESTEYLYSNGQYRLHSFLSVPTLETSQRDLNRQAFYLYVLARTGQSDLGQLDMLFGYREKMSYEGRAYLLMAYQEQFPHVPAVNTLLSDMTSGVILSATGAHWEEPESQNWGSDTRTTALVLRAILRSQPENELLPNVVRWLMIARQGDHWITTQENTWAILALTDWMVTTQELQGDYHYRVELNRESVIEQQVTFENVASVQSLRVEVNTLLRDELNRLLIQHTEGKGVLYYSAYLNLKLPISDVKAISRGVTVSRDYFLSDDLETPISSAKVGDIVLVRLTITAPQDIYFFVLEDPLPAGLENLNPLLANSSKLAILDFTNGIYPGWNWGSWYFDHREHRDERTSLYADYFPHGTYTYTYLAQVTTSGEFQVMPAMGYAFYQPDIFGRTDGMIFSVVQVEDQVK